MQTFFDSSHVGLFGKLLRSKIFHVDFLENALYDLKKSRLNVSDVIYRPTTMRPVVVTVELSIAYKKVSKSLK